jgi:hypothetical protein
MSKPRVTSEADRELDKVQSQFEAFDETVKSMTLDRMNETPKQEVAPQTNLSQRDIEKSKEIYLKPKRKISCKEPFNERYRSKYEFAKEYVQFIAENHEIIGEKIEIWTRPYAGMPAEEWEVPVNKPVFGPRYLAEQIKRKFYHRLTMQNTAVENGHYGTITGNMVVDTTIPRLDARPVSTKKSVFM